MKVDELSIKGILLKCKSCEATLIVLRKIRVDAGNALCCEKCGNPLITVTGKGNAEITPTDATLDVAYITI